MVRRGFDQGGAGRGCGVATGERRTGLPAPIGRRTTRTSCVRPLEPVWSSAFQVQPPDGNDLGHSFSVLMALWSASRKSRKLWFSVTLQTCSSCCVAQAASSFANVVTAVPSHLLAADLESGRIVVTAPDSHGWPPQRGRRHQRVSVPCTLPRQLEADRVSFRLMRAPQTPSGYIERASQRGSNPYSDRSTGQLRKLRDRSWGYLSRLLLSDAWIDGANTPSDLIVVPIGTPGSIPFGRLPIADASEQVDVL